MERCATEITLQIKSEPVDENQKTDENNQHSTIMIDNDDTGNKNDDKIDYNQQSHNNNNSLYIEKHHQELFGSINSEFSIENVLIKTENYTEEIDENNQHSNRSLGDGNNESIRNNNNDKDLLSNEQCNDKFECNICKKKLKRENTLRRHLYYHFAEKPHHCSRDKKFICKSALTKHLLSHVDTEYHQSNISSKDFTANLISKWHSLVHNDEKPYQCDICSEEFWTNEDLKKHFFVHSDDRPYPVNIICVKKVQQPNNEETRLKIEGKNGDEEQKIDEEMENNDNKIGDGTNYNQQPEKQSVCTEENNQELPGFIQDELKIEEACLKIENHSKKIHESSEHTSISPGDGISEGISNDDSDKSLLVDEQCNIKFECNVCRKEFKDKWSLKTHLLIHAGKAPYQCDRCHRKFVHKSTLKTHLLSHTREKRNERNECHICGKMFPKLYLERHLLTHTDERLYQCDICNKKFESEYSLKDHFSSVHTVKKILHHCNVCDKTFWRNEDLEKHSVLHTGRCLFCGRLDNPTVNFHRFPTNVNKRQEWINALGVANKDVAFYSTKSICSNHFSENSYTYPGSRMLNRNALPLPLPSLAAHSTTNPVPIDPVPSTSTSSPETPSPLNFSSTKTSSPSDVSNLSSPVDKKL